MQNHRTLTIMIIATLTLLVSCGSSISAQIAAGDDAASIHPTALSFPIGNGCAGVGDVFELDSPGTYAAFATQPSGRLVTEVRGSQGRLLATTHPVAANTSAVDVRSGLAHGMTPPPQVFTVDSSVSIHVEHDADPYDLIVIRLGNEQGSTSPVTLQPVVERTSNESGSCPNDQFVETFHIELDSVYSDLAARQTFVIKAPVDAVVEGTQRAQATS